MSATKEKPGGADAHAAQESTSMRNPHIAAKPASLRRAKELMKMLPEERTLAMWRDAHGCPVSDEAKVHFAIEAVGRSFRLADVRLWQEHHKRGAKDEKGAIFLEFFFDGCLDELGENRDEFVQAFERMIEATLRERRAQEFRKRLSARRRPAKTRAAAAKALEADEGCVEGGAGSGGGYDPNDQDWQAYLKKPVPATDVSVRAMRDAGCMIRFLVCQTSLSVAASEELGQVAFPEHFPIDGVPQQIVESTKPLPRWVYGMLICTVAVVTITLTAWWKVAHELAAGTYGMQRQAGSPDAPP